MSSHNPAPWEISKPAPPRDVRGSFQFYRGERRPNEAPGLAADRGFRSYNRSGMSYLVFRGWHAPETQIGRVCTRVVEARFPQPSQRVLTKELR